MGRGDVGPVCLFAQVDPKAAVPKLVKTILCDAGFGAVVSRGGVLRSCGLSGRLVHIAYCLVRGGTAEQQ